jgi:GT2 family glycosyltransferase
MTLEPGFPSDVSIAIVAHNNRTALPAAIESVLRTGCPEARITVVDSASADGTAEWLARDHPRITVVSLGANRGPNPGRNDALRRGQTRYVLVMDADVRLVPDTAARLRRAMDIEHVAVATPLVLNASTPDRIQYGGGGLHFIGEAVNAWQDRAVAERGEGDAEVGAAPGCALLIDGRAAAHVGFFDERYFMGKEDGDFLHRIRIAGFTIREVGSARVLHDSGPRTTWLFAYQIRNRWHFLLRNYEAWTLLVLAPALAAHEVLQFGVLAASGHAGAWVRAVVGLIRMLPALPADRAAVARYRRAGDRRLLRDDPLIVRADLAGGRAGRAFKKAYDAWLRAYWRLVRPMVSAR